MSFVGSMFSGSKGAGFQAAGPSGEQMDNSYQQAQAALAQQQALAQTAGGQAPGAVQTQAQLAQQLAAQAQGQGPNPAQAALAQATGQNVANQAALAAGQRGAGSNVGLMARQIGQQGAGIQQQAVGQSATMQAQQQLAAQQQLQQLAASQMGQAEGAVGAGTQAALGNQGQFLGAQTSASQQNAGIAKGNQQFQQGMVGGGIQALGSAIFGNKGGMVPKMADGGSVGPQSFTGKFLNQPVSFGTNTGDDSSAGYKAGNQAGTAIGSALGKQIKSAFSSSQNPTADSAQASPGAPDVAGPAFSPGPSEAMGPAFRKGGQVSAMVSPGEEFIPPKEVKKVAQGKENALQAGKVFPGKPKVKGDSLKNDTISTKLETGGIVIPNHVMQSKNPAEQAKKFVQAVLAKQSLKRQKS